MFFRFTPPPQCKSNSRHSKQQCSASSGTSSNCSSARCTL
uniref:Serk1 n=1 Tax=Arundo donax TaxID=35708 RepID=A0A0A8ZTE5_ARUDO